MNRNLRIILAVLLIAAVVAGVILVMKYRNGGGPDGGTDGREKPEPEPPDAATGPLDGLCKPGESERTLVVFGNNTEGDARKAAALRELAGAFTRANSCVKVKIVDHSFAEFPDTLKEFLDPKADPATVTVPDVFTWFAGQSLTDMIRQGQLAHVTSVWTHYKLSESRAASQKALTREGKQYGVPYATNPWAIYYHKDTFQENELEIPTNWDDLLAICKKLKRRPVAPFAIGTRSKWPAALWFGYLNLRINGLEFHAELLQGKQAYNGEKVKDVLKEWAKLINAGCYTPKNHDELWEQEAFALLKDGKAAMYLMDLSAVSGLSAEERKAYGVFRFPDIRQNKKSEIVHLETLHIPAKKQENRDAVAFLAYAATSEWWRNVSRAPAWKKWGKVPPAKLRTGSAQSGDPSTAKSDVKPSAHIVYEATDLANYYDRDTPKEMRTLGRLKFQEFMLNPSRRNQKKILNELEAQREKIYGPLPKSSGE